MYDLPRVCYNPAKGVCTWYQLKAESHVNICYYVVQYEHDYTYVRNRCSKETDQADSTYHAQLLLHVYFVYVIR